MYRQSHIPNLRILESAILSEYTKEEVSEMTPQEIILVISEVSKNYIGAIEYIKKNKKCKIMKTENKASGIDKEEETDLLQELGEKEVMIAAFAKFRKIFQGRSWVMDGRGAYPYNDDRYKEEVRYIFDEFEAIEKDMWENIKTKTHEYRQKIISDYLKEKDNTVTEGKVKRVSENNGSRTITNAPEVIYLQLGTDTDEDVNFLECDAENITWCADNIHNSDLKYILQKTPSEPSTIPVVDNTDNHMMWWNKLSDKERFAWRVNIDMDSDKTVSDWIREFYLQEHPQGHTKPNAVVDYEKEAEAYLVELIKQEAVSKGMDKNYIIPVEQLRKSEEFQEQLKALAGFARQMSSPSDQKVKYLANTEAVKEIILLAKKEEIKIGIVHDTTGDPLIIELAPSDTNCKLLELIDYAEGKKYNSAGVDEVLEKAKELLTRQ